MGALFGLLTGLFLILMLLDCLQTRQIAAHPERWHEKNPILRWLIEQGRSAGGGAREAQLYMSIYVGIYFAVCAVLALIGLSLLMQLVSFGAAMVLLGFMTVIQLGVVIRNASIGIDPFPDLQDTEHA